MSAPGRETAADRARAPVGADGAPSAGSSAARCCRAGAAPSILEVVVGPSGLEVYERAGEGAIGVLEQKLRALGLRLSVRRRSLCG